MHQSCKSCGARYAIPDEKVERAGARGLRVRCARCRAIMVVASSEESEEGAGGADEARPHTLIAHPIDNYDDDTKPDLPENRRGPRSAVPARALGGLEETSGPGSPPPPTPALLSVSGVYRPLPGVERSMTGLHVAERGTRRVWYAAVRGRSRGPFSDEEMLFLAREGKVRGSSLVWRPGFAEWVRVSSKDAAPELGWLRRVVAERKRQERRAAHRAEERLGIHRLELGADAGLGRSPERTPPPLPFDAIDDLPDVGPRAQSTGGRTLSRLHRRPSPWPQRVKMFAAGALFAALGLVLALYTVPELQGVLADGTVASSAP